MVCANSAMLSTALSEHVTYSRTLGEGRIVLTSSSASCEGISTQLIFISEEGYVAA